MTTPRPSAARALPARASSGRDASPTVAGALVKARGIVSPFFLDGSTLQMYARHSLTAAGGFPWLFLTVSDLEYSRGDERRSLQIRVLV